VTPDALPEYLKSGAACKCVFEKTDFTRLGAIKHEYEESCDGNGGWLCDQRSGSGGCDLPHGG
jgi:hypothetical protein